MNLRERKPRETDQIGFRVYQGRLQKPVLGIESCGFLSPNNEPGEFGGLLAALVALDEHR